MLNPVAYLPSSGRGQPRPVAYLPRCGRVSISGRSHFLAIGARPATASPRRGLILGESAHLPAHASRTQPFESNGGMPQAMASLLTLKSGSWLSERYAVAYIAVADPSGLGFHGWP